MVSLRTVNFGNLDQYVFDSENVVVGRFEDINNAIIVEIGEETCLLAAHQMKKQQHSYENGLPVSSYKFDLEFGGKVATGCFIFEYEFGTPDVSSKMYVCCDKIETIS
jgi:hypothetical protein